MKMKRLLLSLFALVIIGVFTTRANCTTDDNVVKKENEWFKPEVFWDLDRNGSLSRKNIFDCLTSDVKTYDALYSKMREKFPDKVDSIKACFNRYGLIDDVEDPITGDVTFSGRTVSESTTVTGTNISVQNVNVTNGAKLTLVGNVSIYSTFLVESGSSLEIRQR